MACGGNASEESNSGSNTASENTASEDTASEDTVDPEALVYCPDVGPPCGLTVTFEPAGLAIGDYSIEITTTSGVTSCSYAVEPVRIQTPAEAEAQDAMLAECAAQGSCARRPCTGANTVYVRPDGLTIVEESIEVSIVVRELPPGQVSQQSFAPIYADHPARTAQCSMCRVANDSMQLSQ